MNNPRHKPVLWTHPDVMMDDCHIDLLRALVLSSKPHSILEIGIGSGAMTVALLGAIELNGIGTLTCVDNFGDWNFEEPKGFEWYTGRVKFIKDSDHDFCKGCQDQFDFVISDADHAHAGEWFTDTLRLVTHGGFLIYHDATNPHCPSICGIVDQAQWLGLTTMVFNRSSQSWERCERGLLVIKKP